MTPSLDDLFNLKVETAGAANGAAPVSPKTALPTDFIPMSDLELLELRRKILEADGNPDLLPDREEMRRGMATIMAAARSGRAVKAKPTSVDTQKMELDITKELGL